MHPTLLRFLRSFPTLTEAERQLIAELSDVQTYRKGTYLLQEGEIARHCYLVLRGCVREFLCKSGEEKSVGFYTEGQSVNSFTSSATRTPARHNLVCNEECLLAVSSEALEETLCRLVPRLEPIIRQGVEEHAGKVQDRLATLITSSPEERYRELMQTQPNLLNRVPQHQIASYIGVAPESLSRIRKRITKGS